MKPEDVELIHDDKEVNFPNTNWNQVKIQAAIAAMQALISTDRYGWMVAEFAVKNANALVEELKEELK